MALVAARLVAVLLQPRPDRLRRLARLLRKVGCGVRRRRRRGRAQQLVQHPRSPQYRRRAVAIRSPQQHRALAQQARALFFGQRDLAELGADDAGDAVVASQLVIQERVVGGQEIHHAAVFQKDAADESFRFLREIVPQLFVEPGNNFGSGCTESRVVRFSHFIAKLVTRLEALGSASMRLTCFSNAPGLVKPPAAASVSSSSSGPVFHRKNERREASSRSVRANSAFGRCALRARESRGRENPGWPGRPPPPARFPDRSCRHPCAPGFIKRHEAGHIFGGHRPAERAPRQVFRNLLRAGRLARFFGDRRQKSGRGWQSSTRRLN